MQPLPACTLPARAPGRASRCLGPATVKARQLSPPGRVQVLPLDLASLASVQTLATTVQAGLRAGALPPLPALVCNAGIQFAEGLHRTKALSKLLGLTTWGILAVFELGLF